MKLVPKEDFDLAVRMLGEKCYALGREEGESQFLRTENRRLREELRELREKNGVAQ